MRRLDLVASLRSRLWTAALATGLIFACAGLSPLAADSPIDWIATDAFGDVAARAGWRPVTDWVFDEGSSEPRVVPGVGVLVDSSGDAADLYTLASFGDLEVSGEFCLTEGSRAVLRFLGRYDIAFSERRGTDEAVFGDPGSIIGMEPDSGIAPRIGIECAPRIWHRFSVTVRAPRFDRRGVRLAPAAVLRVLLDGIVLQVGMTLDTPSAGAPAFEVAEAPFALRSADGPVAFRKLAGRPLDLGGMLGAIGSGPPPLTRVVLFSRTASFRHGSIPVAIEALRGIGKRQGFAVVSTEDPEQLLSWLDGTDVVVFLNTTGDILSDAQQPTFESYVSAGGGFLGIHAAADTEYDWPWYGMLVGAYFSGHPAIQTARVQVVDRAHPATAMLTEVWTREDEWYNYRERPPADARILATLDVASYEGSTMGEGHPIMWCREIAGGRSIYIGGGHTDESYADPLFLAHLLGALRWAAGDDEVEPRIPDRLMAPPRKDPTPEGSQDGDSEEGGDRDGGEAPTPDGDNGKDDGNQTKDSDPDDGNPRPESKTDDQNGEPHREQ